jgi:hypothetical protein
MCSHRATSPQVNRTWLLQVEDNVSAARDPEKNFKNVLQQRSCWIRNWARYQPLDRPFARGTLAQRVGIRPAFGFASILRLDHRRT